MKKEFLELMKTTGAIRKFTTDPITKEQLEEISDSAIWGPSILGIQPWRFIFVENEGLKRKIGEVLSERAEKVKETPYLVIRKASKIILEARVLIAVYVNNKVSKRARKHGEIFGEKTKRTEYLSSGAAVQNMLLTISVLGLGAVWLDSPAWFPEDINVILGEKDELVSIIAVGVPNQEAFRAKRDKTKIVKYIYE